MTALPGDAAKRRWPLFLVAALSFVPFIGILFGGAGATWGLISSRRHAIRAAMIAMTGTLLNFAFVMRLGFGAASSTPGTGDRFTQQELLKIVIALEDYHATEHAYPPTLQVLRRHFVLRRVVPTIDVSAAGIHFPREYRYVPAADGESYDLVATGPDNVIGTSDDIRPSLPDSLKSTSGYRPVAGGAHP